MGLRVSFINLLCLYLAFCLILDEDHNGLCEDTVWRLPKPTISLQAFGDEQRLLVSWRLNHRGPLDMYEVQIGRTENRTIIYTKNITLFSVDSDDYTWTWTSELPLECVDHSVTVRHVYNQTVQSPWSDWITNYGAKPNKSKLFPSERLMREGTSAMFCCVPSSGVNITSITLNDRSQPLVSIGARVKAVVVDKLTIPTNYLQARPLLCKDTAGQEDHVWNYISVPPQKPKHLRCATSDMTTVTCTWDPDRQQYGLHEPTHTLFIENAGRAPINCKQASCTFQAVPQLEQYNISVVVKHKLGEETESYSFNISDRVFPVVKWDRVSPGVTDTTVSWIIQGSLTEFHLRCWVTVDPGSITELGCSGANRLCKVQLQHLLPNTVYSTSVRCSVNGKLWGEWTQPITFRTYPLVTLDIWRRIEQTSDPNRRRVTLLWNKHVPGSATPVNIQGYVVHWSQGGRNGTERQDGGQMQAEVFISAGQCNFTVQAVILSGSSIPAHITIPQSDDGETPPVEKRLMSSTNAGFNLSWEQQDAATCGYTVEWCTLGNTVPCTLSWIKVLREKNTLFLPNENSKAGCRYTFNIYGCTENGHRLLEIQTGYSQELQFVQFPSLVEPVQSTSSSVTLEWDYNEEDPAHPAFITGYLVTVQETGPDTMPGHVKDLFNVSVADPHRKSVTIEGLQQNQQYVLSVSALTKEGPGSRATITVRTRINYSAHLAKILTPILLLLGCAVLLWPQRQRLKSGLIGVFAYPTGMNIRNLQLDSFLQEQNSERLQPQEVEECSICIIEILDSKSSLNETPTLLSPAPPSDLCAPLHADYSPQSPPILWDRPAAQQVTCMTNQTYFHPHLSEVQMMLSNIDTPPDSQESFSVACDYIPSNT